MREEFLTRQSGLIPIEDINKCRVLVIGCGGIGSHTIMALARMGISNITVIDPDVVSEHNVGSQGFDYVDVGKKKVIATKHKVFRSVRTNLKTKVDTVNESSELPKHDIAILAVDNMQARKDIVSLIEAKAYYYDSHIINPSMGGEYLTLDVIPSSDISKFKDILFDDEDAVQETCTTKATIYTTLMISSLICKAVKDIITKNKYTQHITYDIKNNAPISIFDSTGADLIN